MDLSLVSIDSTTVWAHHDAAGMHLDPGRHHRAGGGCRRGREGRVIGGACEAQSGQDAEPDPERDERQRIRRRQKLRLKAALPGRSRGGQTSKVHLAADRKCRPPAFVLTPGQATDRPQFIPVLRRIRVRGPVGRPRTRPDAVAGDKAYSSHGNRAHLSERHIKAVIPEKSDQAANRKKGGSMGGRPASQPRRRPLQGEVHGRAPDQQAQVLAGHRHPIRQDPGQLPRRAAPARLDDLDQRSHPRHPLITALSRPKGGRKAES